MSTSVGSIHYELGLDKSKFDRGTAEASSEVESFGSKAAGVAKGIAVAFGVMATAAAGFALKSAADFEQTRIGLENMLGSADKARDLLADISKFAADTPFQFPELAQATRQLVAFGFSAEDAFDTMKQLGDVSAAVGAPINDLAYLMGTLRTQGRAFTIDLRQFASRGIPIYEYLAKVMGTTEQELNALVEAGKVGFPEVQKAFKMMTAEGGKFHGTMERQSKSLSGLWSTLQDNIMQAGRELLGINQKGDIAQGGAMDRLSRILQGLIQQLPTFIRQVKDLAGFLANMMPVIAGVTAGFIAYQVATNASAIAIGIVTAAQKAWNAAMMANPIGLLAGGIALLATTLLAVSWQSDKTTSAADRLKQAQDNLKASTDALKQAQIEEKDALLAQEGAHLRGESAQLAYNQAVANYGPESFEARQALHDLRLATDETTKADDRAREAHDQLIKKQQEKAQKDAEFRRVQDENRRAVDNVKDALNNQGGAIDILTGKLDKINGRVFRYTIEEARSVLDNKMVMNQQAIADARARLGFATGGFTGRGGVNEIAGIVHKGEYVLPQSMVNQDSGTPKGMGATITVNLSGVMARSRADLRDIAKDLIGSINEELRAKNVPVIGGGAI